MMKTALFLLTLAIPTATAFSPSRSSGTRRLSSATQLPAANLEAILFDCDGVLADTERDGHRLAFNIAFQTNGIDETWDEQRYGKLLEIGGGKERMTAHWVSFILRLVATSAHEMCTKNNANS